jgi:cAMP-dependent protein kinase regulator
MQFVSGDVNASPSTDAAYPFTVPRRSHDVTTLPRERLDGVVAGHQIDVALRVAAYSPAMGRPLFMAGSVAKRCPQKWFNGLPMAEETESGATLLAKREYARAVPLLKREHEKYPNNPRIRLQYADSLAGSGANDEAFKQYEATAKYYEDNGLTVQAIAVRKKAEKIQEHLGAGAAAPSAAGKSEPLFTRSVPKSPLFEMLSDEDRAALVKEMEIESHDEGSVIITEGDPGTSMYLISSGEVKVYTRSTGSGGSVYLAKLGEGEFFGEVSVLTGKPRTATITASQRSELLRLDKEKLDNALAKHPAIRQVLDDFYKKRAKHTVEAMIESLKKKG